MSNEDDKPFWWPLVEAAGINADKWEPVKYRDHAKPGEMVLDDKGWALTTASNSHFIYTRYHPPRIRRKKVKMVTWRLCVRLDGYRGTTMQWIKSDSIEAPWCALESQTEPFETVKQLPEEEEL